MSSASPDLRGAKPMPFLAVFARRPEGRGTRFAISEFEATPYDGYLIDQHAPRSRTIRRAATKTERAACVESA